MNNDWNENPSNCNELNKLLNLKSGKLIQHNNNKIDEKFKEVSEFGESVRTIN